MSTTLTSELLLPLRYFYQREGRPIPEFEVIASSSLPTQYYRLLAHSGDMTSKLEEAYSSELRLRVLAQEQDEDIYRREVLLCTTSTGQVTEYGAIEIHLNEFESEVRAEILKGELPLGGILNRRNLRYRSEPKAFLSITPDQRLMEFFSLSAPVIMYGRSNVLLNDNGHTLAEIVEILFVTEIASL